MNIHLKLEEKIKALTSDFDDSPSVIQRECSTIPCAYISDVNPVKRECSTIPCAYISDVNPVKRECSTIPCAYLGNTIPKC